jgi:hypothetical protein
MQLQLVTAQLIDPQFLADTCSRLRKAFVLLLSTMFSLCLLALPCGAAGEMYRCNAKDAVRLQDGGMIGRDPTTAFWHQVFSTFVLDLATATIETRDGTIMEWRVVKRESEVEEFLAVPAADLESAAIESLRLTPSVENTQTLFAIHSVSRLISGVCDAVR